MTQNHLSKLAIVIVVLAVVFYLANSGSRQAETITLLPEMKREAEGLAKISLTQRDKTLELVSKDNVWVVPAKGDYPANAAKVRGFLLKLLDLSVSQKLPTSEKRFEQLGVSEDAVKNKDSVQVRIMKGDGAEVVNLIAGSVRKGQSGGQYVRRADSKDVFVIGEPLDAATAAESWIKTELFSVLRQSVRSVKQIKLPAESEEFVLVGGEINAGERSFKVSKGVKQNADLQDAVVSQVASGLENLKISDVIPATDSKPSLTFDLRTVYLTESGLVYTVDTAAKDERYYAKLSVTFDQNLAREIEADLKRRNDEARKRFEEAKKGEQGKEGSAASFVEEKLQLSSAEEAARLTSEFAKWVYEFPQYQAERYRHNASDLLKVETK